MFITRIYNIPQRILIWYITYLIKIAKRHDSHNLHIAAIVSLLLIYIYVTLLQQALEMSIWGNTYSTAVTRI